MYYLSDAQLIVIVTSIIASWPTQVTKSSKKKQERFVPSIQFLAIAAILVLQEKYVRVLFLLPYAG